MKRKIIEWEEYQPPREWIPTLECGHTYSPDDEDWPDDEEKEAIEREGNAVECVECSRLDQKVKDAEAKAKAAAEEARKLREQLEATQRHSEEP